MPLLSKGGLIRSKVSSTPSADALLLLHYDGDFADAKGNTVNLVGTPTINSSIKKFGSGSGLFPGDSALQIPSSSFVFPGDCTFESWVRFTNFPPTLRIIFNTCISQKTGAWAVGLNTNGTVSLEQFGFGLWLNTSVSIVDSAFHHLVFTRNAGTIRIFIDGVIRGEFNENAIVGTTSVIGTTDGVTIGSRGGSIGSQGISGLLDETLISPTGKYTANFTPSASPYS